MLKQILIFLDILGDDLFGLRFCVGINLEHISSLLDLYLLINKGENYVELS